MNTVIYFLLALAFICLLYWGVRLSNYDRLWTLSNVLLLVIIGLIYDNFVIALGKYIGEGSILETLSYPRYWLHILFTPTLIIFSWNVCFKVGLSWAKKAFWKGLAVLLTFGLIIYETFTSLMGLVLEAKWENGLLTYTAVGSQSPIMVIVITLVLVAVGFVLLKNFQFSWLLFGTLFMIVGSFLASLAENFPIMNFFEFVLILSLLMTRKFEVSHQTITVDK